MANPKYSSQEAPANPAICNSGRAVVLPNRHVRSLPSFNVLDLVDNDWGLVKETGRQESAFLLAYDGWDAMKNRPIYRVTTPQRNAVVVDESRWRIQIGARYHIQ